MERYFERSYASLDALFGFLDGILDAGGVSGSDAFEARLVLEELFTNMVKYSTSKVRDVAVRLDLREGELVMVLTDFEAEPFDPTAHPPPDVGARLAERRAGGLGLHLVRSMVDSISHEYAEGKNIITLKKKIAK